MEYKICAIKDRSIEAYINVHVVRAEGQAIRQFMDALADQKTGTLHTHPDDYDLYCIGHYDDNTGHITPETPRKIADGKQLTQEN